MNYHGREFTRIVAPAAPPVDLNDKITPIRAALFLGGAVLGAAVFGLGAAVARLGLASSAAERDMGGWTWLFVGGAVAVAGGSAFALAMWALYALVSYEIRSRRLWEEQVLAERQAAGGLVTSETYTEWSLRVDDPRHVLLAAIAIYWQHRYAGEETPWSVRALRRLEMSGRRSSTLIATCSEDSARQLGDLLTRAGVIEGRGPRAAGRLAVGDADELLERVVPLLRLPAAAQRRTEGDE